MYGLSLEWARCPDGVEIVDLGEPDHRQPIALQQGGKRVRYRTVRRENRRYDINNLEFPILLNLVNARDDDARLAFLATFGLLAARDGTEEDWDAFNDWQRALENLLWKAGSGDPVRAMQSVNDALSAHTSFALVPSLDLAGGRKVPRLALQPQSLLGLVLMETAMIAANDARTATCQHCGKIFITGPLTGRRSHAVYCRDSCRVAAMRKRHAERKP